MPHLVAQGAQHTGREPAYANNRRRLSEHHDAWRLQVQRHERHARLLRSYVGDVAGAVVWCYRELAYEEYTRVGRREGKIRFLSAIGNVLCDLLPVNRMDIQQSARLRGRPTEALALPDHVPLLACLPVDRSRPAVRWGWPAWVFKAPGVGVQTCGDYGRRLAAWRAASNTLEACFRLLQDVP